MPLIKVQISTIAPEQEVTQTLLKTLSSKLASHLGKPESYVMTMLEAGIAMTFGGTFEPVCYVEIKSIGTMNPSQTKAMSLDFCTEITEKLHIPSNRIYIEFADARGAMWGWNGSTFG